MPHRNPPRKDVIQYLQALGLAGVTELPRVEIDIRLPPATEVGEVTTAPAKTLPVRGDASSPAPTNHQPGSQPTAYPPPIQPERRGHALEILAEEVAQCHRCEELAARRRQTVFGVGDPLARVVFFGEAPGADEDRLGEPFVGKAGQLLDRILVASSLSRGQVYILNTLKCRPPANRNPNEAEMANCCSYWQRQLEIIQPEYIVCLGAFAVRRCCRWKRPSPRLRGRFHAYRDSKVIATYHPAYLLRNESAKRLVWEDMKMLMREMGLEVPRPADG